MRKHLAFFALFLGSVLVMGGNALSQTLAGEIVSREVRSENDVVITYNLKGPPEARYDVELYLVWGLGNRRNLEKTKGDIGSGIAPGINKTIHWDMKSELPDAIEGMNYRFDLKVTISTGGGFPWEWCAAGAAVLGGVLYLTSGTTTATPPIVTPPSVPVPPSR